MLGGSRARGTHTSDYDLGLYYRGELDVQGLRAALASGGARGEVNQPCDWGPWINGGGWLTCEGRAVDIIYRDQDKVQRIVHDCLQGRIELVMQPGHPFGFHTPIYAGELACGQVLWGNIERPDMPTSCLCQVLFARNRRWGLKRKGGSGRSGIPERSPGRLCWNGPRAGVCR